MNDMVITCTVFEIKVLFCAPAGCKEPQNDATDHLFMCYSLYESILKSGKACTYRAAKMCTPGTGRTLNF